MLNFRKLTLDDRSAVEDAVRLSGSMSCQTAFPALYALDKYGAAAAITDSCVFLRQSKYDTAQRIAFLTPLPRLSGASAAEFFGEIEEYCRSLGVSPCFCDVTEREAELIAGVYPHAELSATPETFDYIYLRSKLTELPGGEFKSCRQEVHRFLKTYENACSMEPITADNIGQVLDFQKNWLMRYGGSKPSGLDAEDEFISRTAADWEALGLRGALLRMNGTVAAYTYGCEINSQVFDILVEKADFEEYPQLYKVINRQFAATLTQYKYINRENDMGVEGVRTAKRRYHPDILLKKYLVTID